MSYNPQSSLRTELYKFPNLNHLSGEGGLNHLFITQNEKIKLKEIPP